MNEQTFYRKLFLRRYALLLQKVEKTYSINPEIMTSLRKNILALDWIDVGVEKLIEVPRMYQEYPHVGE